MPNPGSTIISNQTSSQRLFKFSGAISKCSAQVNYLIVWYNICVDLELKWICFYQSVAYAKCVVENSESLKKDNCAKEFIEFKNCFKNVSIFLCRLLF